MHLEEMHYEGTIIRHSSEASSILLQVTLGCSNSDPPPAGAGGFIRLQA